MGRFGKLILHFNTPELTENLCRMVPGAIVIDNGSTRFPYKGKNRCIRQDNLGFTKGWNRAIETLWDEFDVFWLMNSDIQVSRSNLYRIETLAARPDLLFFTPSFNCWMKHCQPNRNKKIETTTILEFTAPIIRKEVFERIGLFDPIFAMGYGVEFDFCYRAKQAGIPMHVDHRSSFYHMGQQTISKHGGILDYSKHANYELKSGLLQKYGPNYESLVFEGLTIKTDLGLKIAVYTTLFGDYDTLKSVPMQEVNADYFVVSDAQQNQEGWKTIIPNFPRKDLGARMRAKFFKLFPWELTELSKYDITIYIDASIQVTSANFIATCVKNLTNDFLLFRHPQRNCIYQEGIASKELRKYQHEPIDEQLNYYRSFHPANAGLYACGVMIRRHTDVIKKIMGDWWFEQLKFSFQDQLSLPIVLKANNYVPTVFEENQYKNSFFRVLWHDDNATPALPLPAPSEGGETWEFTVLMPVWKTPIEKLKDAIDSILWQNYTNYELLIVDDHNEDPEIVSLLTALSGNNSVVRVVRTEENKGLAAALDLGIAHSRGKYIVRMDSDDVAHSLLLQTHHDFFGQYPDAVLCGVQINLMLNGKYKNRTHHAWKITRKDAYQSTGFWLMNHPGACYRRDVVLALGGYGDTGPGFPEDYALWCKFLKGGYSIYNHPDVLIDYTLGDGSQIGQDRKSQAWKDFLTDQKNQLKPS